jgi:hypothetical protein
LFSTFILYIVFNDSGVEHLRWDHIMIFCYKPCIMIIFIRKRLSSIHLIENFFMASMWNRLMMCQWRAFENGQSFPNRKYGDFNKVINVRSISVYSIRISSYQKQMIVVAALWRIRVKKLQKEEWSKFNEDLELFAVIKNILIKVYSDLFLWKLSDRIAELGSDSLFVEIFSKSATLETWFFVNDDKARYIAFRWKI